MISLNTMPQFFTGLPPANPSTLPSLSMTDLETGMPCLPAHHLSCVGNLRMLLQLSRLNNQSRLPNPFEQGDAVRTNVYATHSPSERREQERIRARAKLASMKERKAQFTNCISPRIGSGKRIRRISSLYESLPSVPKPTPKQEDDEESTICMHVSSFGDEPDLLEYQNIDDIFDDDESACDESFENSRKLSLAVGPVVQTKQTTNETFHVRRPVSQVSFGYGSQETRQQITSLAPKSRNLTPKESGASSWDDVSSIATLSRLGGFEPEPLPMGHSPIPLVIFVPTAPTVKEDWLEPLSVFPPGYSSPNGLGDRLGRVFASPCPIGTSTKHNLMQY